MQQPEIIKEELRTIQQELDRLNAEKVLLEMELALSEQKSKTGNKC